MPSLLTSGNKLVERFHVAPDEGGRELRPVGILLEAGVADPFDEVRNHQRQEDQKDSLDEHDGCFMLAQ